MMKNMKSSDYTLFRNVVQSQKKTLILSLSLPGVFGELRVKNHALLPICKIGYVSFKTRSSLTEIPNPILSRISQYLLTSSDMQNKTAFIKDKMLCVDPYLS